MLRSSVALIAIGASSALGALLTTSLAWAEPEAVQVLALQSDDAVERAQALTLALKNATRRQRGVQLEAGDFSLEVLSLALGCPDTPDQACLDKIASKINAPSFLWGTLQQSGSKLDLKLNLYRKNGPRRAAEIRYAPKGSDAEATADVADRAVSQLFGVEESPAKEATVSGKLLLNVGTLDGQIVIDGAPVGPLHGGHAELPLEAGEHSVIVRAGGFRDAEGNVTILNGKDAVLELHPRKLGEPSRAPVRDDESSGERSSNAGAAWGAIIAGGAFGAAGVYSTLRVNAINHDADFDSYRAGISKNDDACSEAKRNHVVPGATSPGRISDLCSQSKTFEALQYVFFGLGAAAAGTGALILITGDKAPPTKNEARTHAPQRHAEIAPSVLLAPNAARVDLRVRF